jgi:hypothetical protein
MKLEKKIRGFISFICRKWVRQVSMESTTEPRPMSAGSLLPSKASGGTNAED